MDLKGIVKTSFSILNCDFYNLSGQLIQAEQAKIDMLHLDIMDGHFVPNLSIGPQVVSSLRKRSDLFFDVHLMVDNPDSLLDPFIDSGADLITVHAEVCPHLQRTLSYIKDCGKKAGVALTPSTPLCYLENVMDQLDLILIMTVNPGFGGQEFIPGMLDKIRRTAELIKDYRIKYDKKKLIEIQADGGIDLKTAARVVSAGATVLVMGTALCHSGDIEGYLNQVRETL
ncbi:MAG: ribulose-phosphate 3-epimerase [Actinomycetota bacterium]|nr:ribulose-phosphate 3-epimerase [Actinomycetota bacterium]